MLKRTGQILGWRGLSGTGVLLIDAAVAPIPGTRQIERFEKTVRMTVRSGSIPDPPLRSPAAKRVLQTPLNGGGWADIRGRFDGDRGLKGAKGI